MRTANPARLAALFGYAVTAAVMASMSSLILGNHTAGAGSSDWIPSGDQDLDAFATNFDTLVTASPGTYGLDASIATAFNTQRLAFTAALALAVNPATSTTVTVGAKDAEKANLKTLLRQDGAIVQATPSVSNEDKIALGLTIRTETPSPIPAPDTFPLLDIMKATPLGHTIRYADSDTPDSARKPSGAVGMELRVGVSAAPIVDAAAIPFYALATRNPFQITYSSDDKGKQAYIAGRWLNPKGEAGPWSTIQNFTVAA